MARKILDLLSWPLREGSRELNLSASLGISLFPADADGAETLLRNADTALARAKERGGKVQAWHALDLPPLRMAVNLSGRHLRGSDVAEP